MHLSVCLTLNSLLTTVIRSKLYLARLLQCMSIEEVIDLMLQKISRLFVIKTRPEAILIIYALALGATARGSAYLEQYQGVGGVLLFFATTGAVFLAGAKLFDCLRYERELEDVAAMREELEVLRARVAEQRTGHSARSFGQSHQ